MGKKIFATVFTNYFSEGMELKGLEHMSFTQRLRLARNSKNKVGTAMILNSELFEIIGKYEEQSATNLTQQSDGMEKLLKGDARK